jgi:hypothetical protein
MAAVMDHVAPAVVIRILQGVTVGINATHSAARVYAISVFNIIRVLAMDAIARIAN